jgi:hypothetical protein
MNIQLGQFVPIWASSNIDLIDKGAIANFNANVDFPEPGQPITAILFILLNNLEHINSSSHQKVILFF